MTLTTSADYEAAKIPRLFSILEAIADDGWSCQIEAFDVGYSGPALICVAVGCPGGRHRRFNYLGAIVDACRSTFTDVRISVHCGCGATDDRYRFVSVFGQT